MKNLKKYSAAFLAICLMTSVGTTAFAADLNGEKTKGDSIITAKTTLSAPTYTITIPTTIPVEELVKTSTSSVKSTSFDVTASDIANLGEQKVKVSISTADGNFNLSDGTHSLPYQVYSAASGGTALVNGGLYASFTANGTVTGRVDIDQKDIPAAGKYAGTLTFTIALEKN